MVGQMVSFMVDKERRQDLLIVISYYCIVELL
jgi:hypothetical protein